MQQCYDSFELYGCRVWTTAVAQVQASDIRRMDEISKDALREKENRIVGLKEVRVRAVSPWERKAGYFLVICLI